jgi:hypothetical protein
VLLAHRGIPVPRILGWLGWSLGCLERPEPVALADLVPRFRWDRVPSATVAAPAEWSA